MPRSYNPNYYDSQNRYADDLRERGDKTNKTPAWQKWLKYLAIGAGVLFLILILLSATGNLGGSTGDATDGLNETKEPTKYEQLTTYIIAQRQEGLARQEITQRLELAGFSERDIQLGFELSDPIIQQILELQKQGRTQQEIVEILLDQGLTAQEIQAKFEIIAQTQGGTGLFAEGSWLRRNWLLLVPAAILLWYLYQNYTEEEEEKRLPKVYTLDECEEYAREYLDDKGKQYNPSKQYRNRPDIRQYRFIYEEPLYPEFNDHMPTGMRSAKRLYFLVAIGYDKEVIDYQETTNDNLIDRFLYGAPKGFEQSGSREYMGLRAKSEQPVENNNRNNYDEGTEENRYSGPYRRPPPRRIRPGPVRGYEEQ